MDLIDDITVTLERKRGSFYDVWLPDKTPPRSETGEAIIRQGIVLPWPISAPWATRSRCILDISAFLGGT